MKIETLPIETKPVDNAQADIQRLALDVANQATAQIMPVLFNEISKRSDAILARAEALAQGTQVVVAIKLGDNPIKKLKREAHDQLPIIVAMLTEGLTPLLVGPAGCGKTMLAEQTAEAMGLEFGHLCFSAGVSETWLFGRQTPKGFIEGQFSLLYKNGGVFLGDELDAADANLLLAINTALANGHLYNPISGENITRHKDFHFIGAANTFGKGGDAQYTGRSRLDAATLDRFIPEEIGYNARIEKQILADEDLRNTLQSLRAALVKRGSNETLSYRAFEKAAALARIGLKKGDILKKLTASWPKTLLKDLGF